MQSRFRGFDAFRYLFGLGLSLFVSTAGFAQGQPSCTTFDTGTLEGWTTQNTSTPVFPPHAGSGSYIELKDKSGPSQLLAPANLLGNLAEKLGCGQFCFDVNLFKNGSDAPPVLAPIVTLYSGTAFASFAASPGISAGSGWHTVCAPISNPGPPTSTAGTWTVGGGGTWSSIINNVTKLTLPVDWKSSSWDEVVGYDNLCFKPGICPHADFTFAGGCAGDPLQFTDASLGVIGYSWTFSTGSPATSTAPNPVVTFGAGTHTAKLCINGGSQPPLCVTKTVVIAPKPTPPVINGPVTACNAPATYCVNPVDPNVVAYNWTVSPPSTIVGSSTGACVQVNWSPPGAGGWVGVKATNKHGCSSSSRVEVKSCTGSLAECCQCNELSVKNEKLSGSTFTAAVTATPMPITRVAVDLISTSVVPFGPGCGTAGSRDSLILAAGSSLGALSVSQPVPFSRDIVFSTTAPAPLVSAPLTLNLQLPGISGTFWCGDFLSFCLKYSFTGRDCKTCELIECYGPYKRSKIILPDDLDDVTTAVRFDLRIEVLADDGTLNSAASGTALLRLKPGTSAPGAQLLGRTRSQVVRGVATFSGLAIDKPGEGYVLEVLVGDGGEPVAETEPFNVRPAGR
jgi:hypothetical protein